MLVALISRRLSPDRIKRRRQRLGRLVDHRVAHCGGDGAHEAASRVRAAASSVWAKAEEKAARRPPPFTCQRAKKPRGGVAPGICSPTLHGAGDFIKEY